jgi:hypothetical protein
MGTGELGVCPRCGWPLEGRHELEAIRALAGDLGIVVDAAGMVSANDAARLVGVAEKTLRNWRTNGMGPNYFRRAGRIRYRLEDLLPDCPGLSLSI